MPENNRRRPPVVRFSARTTLARVEDVEAAFAAFRDRLMQNTVIQTEQIPQDNRDIPDIVNQPTPAVLDNNQINRTENNENLRLIPRREGSPVNSYQSVEPARVPVVSEEITRFNELISEVRSLSERQEATYQSSQVTLARASEASRLAAESIRTSAELIEATDLYLEELRRQKLELIIRRETNKDKADDPKKSSDFWAQLKLNKKKVIVVCGFTLVLVVWWLEKTRSPQ